MARNMYGDSRRERVLESGQLHDLDALPGQQRRRDDLAGELGQPVEVPDVVGDADAAR